MEITKWLVLHTKLDSKGDKSVKYYGPFAEKADAVHKQDKLWNDNETYSVTIKDENT
tara:strand:- start:186 stop:356 length:171 start_codon:yes stop_codon:yes gene_type:complete